MEERPRRRRNRRRRQQEATETPAEVEARRLKEYSYYMFETLDAPQQWIDRMDEAQITHAHMAADARSEAMSLGTPITIPVHEVLPREMAKITTVNMREKLSRYPATNGVAPKPDPAAKPWEAFLPPITGNEANWAEWERGGRSESELQAWECKHCGTRNRTVWINQNNLLEQTTAFPGTNPEKCEKCQQVRQVRRNPTTLLGVPRPERPRRGFCPEEGETDFCYW